MGKLRKKNCTVYGIVEDQIEFLEFLKEIYQTKQNNINLELKNSFGGKPDRIVEFAIRESQRDRSFAWFDEDFEPRDTISENIRHKLAQCWKVEEKNLKDFLKCRLSELQNQYNPNNKKPIIIISLVVCVKHVFFCIPITLFAVAVVHFIIDLFIY